MKYSKNQKLAKEFIRWFMNKQQFEPYFHPLWIKDPKLTIYRDTVKEARHLGYAGPPGAKATEALAKCIIVDMFTKSIQGTLREEAVKWATAELNKIYNA